jgi:hypothetical protein
MRKFIPKSKVSAYLLASDFPSENPRTQTTHYSYTQPLANIMNNCRYTSKFELMYKNLLIILIIIPISTYSQKVYDFDTAEEIAKKESSLNKNPSFVFELGQNFFSWSEENWSERQQDSALIAFKQKGKKQLKGYGFENSGIIFAENKNYKNNYKSIYLNGVFYGRFGGNEKAGYRRICELFFNNPRGTTISNRRYHLSENYFEEYSNGKTSKADKHSIPDSFYYFYYLFRNLSEKGSLLVVFYDKEKSDYQSVVDSYKNLYEKIQTKKNNIGLILIDQSTFPKTFESLAKNKGLVNPNNYQKDFYAQLWYDNQVLFDFYGHKESKLVEMKKLLKILSNVSPENITKHAETNLKLATYKGFHKVKDKETLLKYLDEKSDSKLYQLWNDAYSSTLRIKAEMSRNLGDLKILLRANNGQVKNKLELELYDVEL